MALNDAIFADLIVQFKKKHEDPPVKTGSDTLPTSKVKEVQDEANKAKKLLSKTAKKREKATTKKKNTEKKG